MTATLPELPQDPQELDSRGEHVEYTRRLLQSARRQIDIAARALEPAIYDDTEIVAEIRRVALDNRRAQIRLLALKPEGMEKRGHRLIELAGRLPTFISLRQPAAEDGEFNEALLLIDDSAFIRRPLADRYEGVVVANDRGTVLAHRRSFEAIWERAQPMIEFRRLGI